MARPKEFDVEAAVKATVPIFREYGFKGASAQRLVDAMGIGRQSLYDTFGDKWGLYQAAVELHSRNEVREHIKALTSCDRAIDGIRSMLDRVAATAEQPCLGLNSTVEFGCSHPDLVTLRNALNEQVNKAVRTALLTAQKQGDVATGLIPEHLSLYLISMLAAIRLSARSGATANEIEGLIEIAMRALR